MSGQESDLGPMMKSGKLVFLGKKTLSLGRQGVKDKEIGGCI
jgi:hypothetical protein